jgi:hypothetical protein
MKPIITFIMNGGSLARVNLLGTIDQKSKILGHLARFNSGNTSLFQLLCKLL